MDFVARVFLVGLFCSVMGLIGGLVMAELINRGNTYLFEHPPDDEKNKTKGDEHDEH